MFRRHLATHTRPSPHAQWYAHVLPQMFPIALLGSTVYIGLHLLQTHWARERHLDRAAARVRALERDLQRLRQPTPDAPTPARS